MPISGISDPVTPSKCNCHMKHFCCMKNKHEGPFKVILGWLGSLVVMVLDLQLNGCELDSWPPRCRVTTLGKLFTPIFLCRSQWFSGRMLGCGVRCQLFWYSLDCKAVATHRIPDTYKAKPNPCLKTNPNANPTSILCKDSRKDFTLHTL